MTINPTSQRHKPALCSANTVIRAASCWYLYPAQMAAPAVTRTTNGRDPLPVHSLGRGRIEARGVIWTDMAPS